ncbi:ankyrin repeat domain-containing protein [Phyllobacterium sp. P30BS-XVII]|uniref:ankyrin repeat domain-containing protein n=1 Tax=Phyllobacterium sp. P30BS-XVII TaxID=2587046 RepID=UPI000DDA4593|nr:ankyrin repeat domain-containing protein [Phyllobacterium sp. P30BS-XVII]MBA8899354.1 ankyrin repeat protein [Phyllobacterium sp. P30BS-XVII]
MSRLISSVVLFGLALTTGGLVPATTASAAPTAAECKKLDPNGRDSGGDPHFAIAIRDKKADLVAKMLACGADVNLKSQEGWAPLHTAAYYGPASVIDLLVAKGADVNAKGDYDKMTPLHMAASYGDDPAVIKALLKHGADKTAKTESGKTALELAADKPAIAKLLK